MSEKVLFPNPTTIDQFDQNPWWWRLGHESMGHQLRKAARDADTLKTQQDTLNSMINGGDSTTGSSKTPIIIAVVVVAVLIVGIVFYMKNKKK